MLRLDEIVEVIVLELPLRVLWENSYLVGLVFESLISPFVCVHRIYELVDMLFVLKSLCL